MKYWKFFNIILLIFLIVLTIYGTFIKQLAFGLGLADFLGYIYLYAITSVYLILSIIFRKRKNTIINLIFLALTIHFSLIATLFRGSLYPWNGSTTYLPCPSKIEIRNDMIKKDKLITMCSGDYESFLVSKWNGINMILINGDLKIPKEIDNLIQKPVTKFILTPDTTNFTDERGKQLNFKLDTLRINNQYKLYGEIIGIENGIPVMKMDLAKENIINRYEKNKL